jgi:hypothetical protein
MDDAAAAKSSQRSGTYVVAVLEAQEQSYAPQTIESLPAPEAREAKQLEGPGVVESAAA